MNDTVECPYCTFANDMSDGLVDLPQDNKFDHECSNCEREFEVFVEFSPTYIGSVIESLPCGLCGTVTRDIVRKGRTFPYPNSVLEGLICRPCYSHTMREQYANKK